MTDRQLIKFVKQFRKGILGGGESVFMCFAICAPLVTLLKMHGVQAELVKGDLGLCNHYWLRLPDGRVLDPTLDQFDNTQPPVYLGEETEWHPECELA